MQTESRFRADLRCVSSAVFSEASAYGHYSCYTNHALDQFLEHLISVGIEKIIRIGGKSQLNVLDGKNLRIVSKGDTKSKSEGYLLATTFDALGKQETTIRRLLGQLHSSQKRRDWATMKSHLSQRYPRIHQQFSRIDQEGFQAVGREPFDIWMREQAESSRTSDPQQEIQEILAQATRNAYSVSSQDRQRLVQHWLEDIRRDTADRLYEEVKQANELQKQLTHIHDEINRRVLQTADVIGVTTTGLAKEITTLQRIRSKIMICEEAGEVMEPHIVSALLPSIEHFIQIGDHEQLRPQIKNFKLSLESQQGVSYQLDRSLFERLSIGVPGNPAFPLAQLNVQRRMRPEISTLIRETIYPSLIDHETTKQLPDVVGMRKNVFWLDHDNMEEEAQNNMHQKSHSNLWEIDIVHALVRHVLRQGTYDSASIAVLTPYNGQLQRLRAKMRNDFEIVLSERDQEALARDGFDVDDISRGSDQRMEEPGSGKRPLQKKPMSELLRMATVDNFQGEEAKIVIVSLVRSNKQRKVGFLKVRNRINVLISRAQHGMYLIGNANTYSNHLIWARIQSMLQTTGSIGRAFALCCPRHPDAEIIVSGAEDFARLSPEGGCQLICDRRREECGHQCRARCHSESMHKVFRCPEPCERLHKTCNHNCQKPTCSEECGLCMVTVNNVQLPCGHLKDDARCYETQNVRGIRCDFLTQKSVPECRHLVDVPCSRDVTSSTFICPTACESILSCGHRCPGSCGRCERVEDGTDLKVITHVKCARICGRRFGSCNHTCGRPCHQNKECGPCTFECEVCHYSDLKR